VTYLSHTASEGIHYWCEQPIDSLPEAPLPKIHTDTYNLQERSGTDIQNLIGYVDSDWATNTKKRTSMTGMVLMMSGGAIGYKSKFQTVIAHSSTEDEFVAACDTAKMISFFRSLLEDIGLEQEQAMVLFEDNNGALLMTNAQQPTKRTRHIDIKHFALLDWVGQDMLILQQILTHANATDTMTKPLTKNLFYHHYDTYMGIRTPKYCRTKQPKAPNTSFMLLSTTKTTSQVPSSRKHGGGGY